MLTPSQIPLPVLPNGEQMQQQAVHELHLHERERYARYDQSHGDLERGLFADGGRGGDLRERVRVDPMMQQNHHLSIIELPVGDVLSGRTDFQSTGSGSTVSQTSTKYDEADQ